MGYTLIVESENLTMNTFRERFLYLQSEKDVSIQEVSDNVGVTRATLSRYVSGKIKLTEKMLRKLANYFDVDIAYLVGESNVRRNEEQLPEDLLEVCKEAADKKISAKRLKAVIDAIIEDAE